MNSDRNRNFYFLSIAALAVLSAYPLINGVRMVYLHSANGALEPEQYAKYVVPYAAICVALLLFAALLPVFMKLKRFAFPAGLISAYGVFFAAERFFETMQIHVTGMTLIDASAPAADAAIAAATADIWQASLCAVSPVILGQSLTYASRDKFFYVTGNTAYKIHYYLISLVLITMVGGLLYGIAKMLRDNDMSQKKPVFLRGVSAAALLALCVFANTTAFFRQAAPVQTPPASILTCLFFVILGMAAGVYTGSYLLKKRRRFGIGIPVSVSLFSVILMYIGEIAMMNGNLYRFGTGWFFDGLSGIVLAPVDTAVVLLSGALTWLILFAARKREKWPGKQTMTAAVAVCVAIAVAGPVIAIAAPANTDGDIRGCYVFEKNLYTSPLSSFMAFGGLPYVYGFTDDAFIIADTGSGEVETCRVEYCKTPAGANEFTSKSESSLFTPPDLSLYKERYLLAVMSDGSGPKYGLYRMDGEIWLAELRSIGIWTIYRIKKTEATTLADLERAMDAAKDYKEPMYAYQNYENQMTLTDVYALARKGESLTLSDFEPFYYQLTGANFTVRRYDVVGADSVFVATGENGSILSAKLLSRRTPDDSNTVDLREGFEAVIEYMNPLKGFLKFTIEDPYGGEPEREMFFEDDYFGSGCRYYLNSTRADNVFVIFENGERMTIKQALQERRVTVEELVANGLYNVSMIPIDNPLGGEFVSLHHLYTFALNGEAFYPSKSFMYVVAEGGFTVYYDIDELIQTLEFYGYKAEVEKLREVIDPADLSAIAGGNYVHDDVLAGAGIDSTVGWAFSSHTQVQISFPPF